MKKIGAMLVVAVAVAACATVSPYYREGARAELNKQYDAAIQFYEKAAAQDPKESVYRLALARARGAAALFRLQQARALAAQGKKKEALGEYAAVLSYDPQNGVAIAEARALEAPAPKPQKPAGIVPESPVKLKTNGEKLNINFRTPVSLKSILDTLARSSGVTFIYDETYRDMNLAVDLTGKDLEQAVNYLCVASKNFYRVVDDKTVIIAPDNFTMRQKYELLVIRTFYLSNINAQDVQLALVNMIKTQTKIPTVQVDKNLNSITIRDTPQAVAQAERLLRAWDKAQPEVLIDIEIMEVERSLLRQLGIDFSKTNLSRRAQPCDQPGQRHGLGQPQRPQARPAEQLRVHQPVGRPPVPRRGLAHEDHRPAQDPRRDRGGHEVPRRRQGPHPDRVLHPDHGGDDDLPGHHPVHPAGRRHRPQDEAPGPPGE